MPAAESTVPSPGNVLVIGAGPAGTAAAITLARAGRRVVVVDKAVFPRDKCCGDGLTTLALRELEPHCHRERVARNLDPFQLRDWQGQVVYVIKGELKLDFANGAVQVIVGGWGDALFPIGRGRLVPVATKAVTDVELLRFDEDLVDIVLTWEQIATPGQEVAGGAELAAARAVIAESRGIQRQLHVARKTDPAAGRSDIPADQGVQPCAQLQGGGGRNRQVRFLLREGHRGIIR